ncbi:hypothetical protein PSTT_08897 [Puccinia striiformis]|uniref:non-specific serine/threonine protein kinase n=1 Tax=Puccinia striiformis TaxID=27350 RepID=A0A2S4VAG6_9BASI|nr:hypothetical protein PSTT_08897 [Puccinia striiformis]
MAARSSSNSSTIDSSKTDWENRLADQECASEAMSTPSVLGSPADRPASPLDPVFVTNGEEHKRDYKKGRYHPVEVGEGYKDNRYRVLRKLGWGGYATVWLAHDRQLDQHVCLKVSKSSKFFTDAAKAEIKFNKRISSANPTHPGHRHLVSLLDHFDHAGPKGTHVCMVFEVLGDNLLAFKNRCKRNRIPAHIVRKIGRQILLAVDYLHQECGIIHTDLKPDNVLICIEDVERVIQSELENHPEGYDNKTTTPLESTPSCSSRPGQPDQSDYGNITVKIADLGNATWATNLPDQSLTTRPYRSPELIIGAPWGRQVDIWSVGCTLAELLTGDQLFKAPPFVREEDHLVQIIEIVGPFPDEFVKTGKFDQNIIAQLGKHPLVTWLMIAIDRLSYFNLKQRFSILYSFDDQLIQCLLKILQIDPHKQWEAKQILDDKGYATLECLSTLVHDVTSDCTMLLCISFYPITNPVMYTNPVTDPITCPDKFSLNEGLYKTSRNIFLVVDDSIPVD